MAIEPLKKQDIIDNTKNNTALSNADPAKDPTKFSFDKNHHSYQKILAIQQMDSNRDLNKDEEVGGSNLGSNRDMQPFLHDAMGSVIISSTSLGSNNF